MITPAAPKKNCEELGQKHIWKKKMEWYSPWSTQSVGPVWRCLRCKTETDKEPK